MNLIDRDKLVDLMCEDCAVMYKDRCREHGPCPAYGYAMNTPAVDAALVVHGEWVRISKDSNMFECSICKGAKHFNILKKDLYNYCPNCGAKMDGGKEGNNG